MVFAGSLGGTSFAAAPAGAGGSTASPSAAGTDYVVLYRIGQSSTAARAAIAHAGGSVVSENTKVGYARVTSADPSFAARVDAAPELEGAASNRVIGQAPRGNRSQRDEVERLASERAASKGSAAATGVAAAAPAAEPLANRQWDMRQIGATPTGSYAVNTGRKGVLVGIIDTGIDGGHPDIAPNFSAALSHNFVTDNPTIDGPCEHPTCVDPADEDDDGHGTHVASTIGSPINGKGIAGVAPDVTLVNIRAGQDSGYFFLEPTLDALTYAGDIGVDVVNMSFYTDPWLFNCLNNPADSPAEQAQQRVIRVATQRALDYARHRGVLPVAAAGNEAIDLGNPTSDDTSPDFPVGTAKHRDITNACLSVPTESEGVTVVSSTGPTTRKAYYSNYGTEQIDVAAPGGDYYDSPDNTGDVRNLVLAAYPRRLAELNGDVDKDGKPTTPFVVRDCSGPGSCSYYQYLQGTSMAAPHAVGVAALIVSRYGTADRANGGVGLDPKVTRARLLDTAVRHACPQPRQLDYTRIRADGTVATGSAFCAGPIDDNGFYGRGIVSAYAAVAGS